jgi:dephospho-CoA kinase
MGKSTVLKAFAELGAHTISSDEVVSRLLAMPPVVKQIKDVLGPGVVAPDGSLDRKAVADIIFEDDARREAYEALIHPLVFEMLDSLLRGVTADVVLVEVPLLYEGGHEIRFKRVVAVYTDENVALERIQDAGRDRMDAARRLMVQMPVGEKVRRSTYTIDNNGTPELAAAQARQVYRALLAEARA